MEDLDKSVEEIERLLRVQRAVLAARGFVQCVHEVAEEAHFIRPTRTTVKVTGGEKAIKGVLYLVVGHGLGSFGPYVQLSHPPPWPKGTPVGLRPDVWSEYDREDFPRINVKHVEVVPDYKRVFAEQLAKVKEFGMDPDQCAYTVPLLTQVAEDGFTPTAWGILADWMEEHDRVWAGTGGGFTAEEFAHELRLLTSGPAAPKFTTENARRHNFFGFKEDAGGII